MARDGWHIVKRSDGLTLARRLPARFDFAAEAAFPEVHMRRLAQQIRQDLWRLLQNLRGFSPVVDVARLGEGLWAKAGGQAQAPWPKHTEEQVATLLLDPVKRARWVRYARDRGPRA